MKLPPLTAETSAYTNDVTYRTAASRYSSGGTYLVPQQFASKPSWCRGACSCCRWKGLPGCCDKCEQCIG